MTWQLFYTISWPLKILKETVVFYYVSYNLVAFKDDFPSPLLLGPACSPLCFRQAFARVAGEPH